MHLMKRLQINRGFRWFGKGRGLNKREIRSGRGCMVSDMAEIAWIEEQRKPGL